MKPAFSLKKGTYVAAISGGIDSIVLLDLLAKSNSNIIVAHFDHGIRDDSHLDARHVEGLAKKIDVPFAVKRADLGPRASEETARNERYAFLEKVKQFHQADAVLTAHHADDAVETMIINMIRGTGWKGLSSLRSHSSMLRPMLNWRKADVVRHAIDNQLVWREDSTNDDVRYLRNHVRHGIANRMHQHTDKLIQYHAEQSLLHYSIQAELKALSSELHKRYFYIMTPDEVALEAVGWHVKNATGSTLTRNQLKRALWFVRTARAGKSLNISKQVSIAVTARELIVSTPKN